MQPDPAGDSCEPGDDADCDGTPNEGCPCVEGEKQPCGPASEIGICVAGVSTCNPNGTWGTCEGAVYAQERDCTSSDDNDCDGFPDNTLDDVCMCTIGDKRDCETHPGQDDVGFFANDELTRNDLFG